MESTSERERERETERERERDGEREGERERDSRERQTERKRDRLFERRKHVKHTDVFAMKETCPRMGQKKIIWLSQLRDVGNPSRMNDHSPAETSPHVQRPEGGCAFCIGRLLSYAMVSATP